jgi:hypothetical protein
LFIVLTLHTLEQTVEGSLLYAVMFYFVKQWN